MAEFPSGGHGVTDSLRQALKTRKALKNRFFPVLCLIIWIPELIFPVSDLRGHCFISADTVWFTVGLLCFLRSTALWFVTWKLLWPSLSLWGGAEMGLGAGNLISGSATVQVKKTKNSPLCLGSVLEAGRGPSPWINYYRIYIRNSSHVMNCRVS